MAIIKQPKELSKKNKTKEPESLSNHDLLVERAVRWLRNTLHCRVVLSELVSYTASGEIPDAIGWVNGCCLLVEVKTSRSDFFADRKKHARKSNRHALGNWRFYFVSPGIIKSDEIPEGWGAFEVHGNRIKHLGGKEYRNIAVAPFQSCRESEIAMLLSALSRCQLLGKKKKNLGGN